MINRSETGLDCAVMYMAMRPILTTALAFIAAIGLTGGGAAATSDWAESHGGKLRLIAPGGSAANGALRAGIEIVMDPGWKTYWRHPGDSGIPPRFDHSASTNIDAVKIDFPAPHRYVDQSGTSIGYKETVVFPVTVTPKNPDAPVVLELAVEYGLCEEICVPAKAKLRLQLSTSLPSDAGAALLLDRFSRRVPVPANEEMSVRSVTVDGDALIVGTRFAEPAAAYDLFVEGPEDWYLPAPDMTASDGARVAWRVPLEWMPKAAKLSGAEFRFTLINGDRAVEQSWRLD